MNNMYNSKLPAPFFRIFYNYKKQGDPTRPGSLHRCSCSFDDEIHAYTRGGPRRDLRLVKHGRGGSVGGVT